MKHIAQWWLVLVAVFGLSGCGQKGDLYQSADAPPPTLEQSTEDKPKTAE